MGIIGRMLGGLFPKQRLQENTQALEQQLSDQFDYIMDQIGQGEPMTHEQEVWLLENNLYTVAVDYLREVYGEEEF